MAYHRLGGFDSRHLFIYYTSRDWTPKIKVLVILVPGENSPPGL